ncbi:protein FAM151A-like [Argonauta hians]
MASDILETKISQLLSQRYFKKSIVARFLLFFVLIVIWIYINGGLLPRFLRHRLPMLRVGPELNILYYFEEAGKDGSKIKWSRATNSQVKLKSALTGNYDMIEADVVLKGQGTEKQSMTPIISDLPAINNGFTLKMWLEQVKMFTKGIKLDFRTIDAVEMSLQLLKGMKDELQIPIWLHADILKGPFGSRLPIDASRFIRNVRTLFPTCTLSLGWTTGHHTDVSQAGYTWDMVLDMHDLITHWEITQPIVFSVRLAYIKNSVPQLKWLCDTLQASLFVWNDNEDKPVLEDVMYVAYRFPPEKSFFNFEDDYLNSHLTRHRHFSKNYVHQLVLLRDVVKFNPYDWVKMGLYIEENSILPSSESLVLKSPAVYIVSVAKLKSVETLHLKGRVHFLNRKNQEAINGQTGLSIFFRSSSYSDYERINGIRFFIGVNGDLQISGQHLNKNIPKFMKSARVTPGASSCYRFDIVDLRKEVVMKINSLHDCDTLESVQREETPHLTLRVNIPPEIEIEDHPYILKLEDNKRVAVIDELDISTVYTNNI